jgi:hypothetical protein
MLAIAKPLGRNTATGQEPGADRQPPAAFVQPDDHRRGSPAPPGDRDGQQRVSGDVTRSSIRLIAATPPEPWKSSRDNPRLASLASRGPWTF